MSGGMSLNRVFADLVPPSNGTQRKAARDCIIDRNPISVAADGAARQGYLKKKSAAASRGEIATPPSATIVSSHGRGLRPAAPATSQTDNRSSSGRRPSASLASAS